MRERRKEGVFHVTVIEEDCCDRHHGVGTARRIAWLVHAFGLNAHHLSPLEYP
jgi:hypothetical protein